MRTARQPLKVVTLVTFLLFLVPGLNSAHADPGISISFSLPTLVVDDVTVAWDFYPELNVYYSPRERYYWYQDDRRWVRSKHYLRPRDLERAAHVRLYHDHRPWMHHHEHRDYYYRHYRRHDHRSDGPPYGRARGHDRREADARYHRHDDRYRNERARQDHREQLARRETSGNREPYYRKELRERNRW